MSSNPSAFQFNDPLFNAMFVKEKKLAFKINDSDNLDEKIDELTRRDKIGNLIMKAQEKMIANDSLSSEEFESYNNSLNEFTVADVYRYALNRYNDPQRVFTCGIERTQTVICQELAELFDQTKHDKIVYIKNILFPTFYTCLKRLNFDDERIYRFFIRLLCLCDGFAAITDILLFRFSDVIRLTTPSSSPSSSPDAPQLSGQSQFRNNNTFQALPPLLSSQQPLISLTSVLFYRFSDPKMILPDSDPFPIQLKYDLQNMSNHPFDNKFSRLFEMHKFEMHKTIRNEEKSLFTTAFEGVQHFGGRTKKTSKKMHRMSKKSKKSNSKKSKKSKSKKSKSRRTKM